MCSRCCHCDVRAKEHNETAHHTVGAVFPMANHHHANNVFSMQCNLFKMQCKPKVTHENITFTRHRFEKQTTIMHYMHTEILAHFA